MNALFDDLMRAFGLVEPLAQPAFLTFLRVGAAISMLPGIGETSLPARLRLALAVMLSMAMLPSTAALPMTGTLVTAFLPEVVIGLTIGFALRGFVFALSIAGSIVANSTSLAQLFSPGQEPQPAIAQLLTLGGISLALEADLLPKAVGFLLASYDALPLGQWPEAGEAASWAARHGDMALSLGLQLSLPFLIGSLLYNLALGIINRAMPQLMVTFIGAPALSLGGLALLAVAVPVMLSVWLAAFNGFLGNPGWGQ